MNSLARLIRKRQADLGLTFRELEARSDVPYSTISGLANKPVLKTVPRADTLELARALDVPVDVVRVCAADAAGYPVDLNGYPDLDTAVDVRLIVNAAVALPPHRLTQLRKIAESFDTPSAD